MQLAFSLLSRSKQITYENLKRRDPAFGAEVDRWWAGRVEERSAASTCRPIIRRRRCSRRSASATMTVQNRVVVSPMNMYSAEPGNIPGDFHLVHLGKLAHGRRGPRLRRDDIGERGCAHHAGLPRHLFAGAGEGLDPHLRFRARQQRGEVLPADRPCRPQGLDAARLGGHGSAAARRQLADRVGVAGEISGRRPSADRDRRAPKWTAVRQSFVAGREECAQTPAST